MTDPIKSCRNDIPGQQINAPTCTPTPNYIDQVEAIRKRYEKSDGGKFGAFLSQAEADRAYLLRVYDTLAERLKPRHSQPDTPNDGKVFDYIAHGGDRIAELEASLALLDAHTVAASEVDMERDKCMKIIAPHLGWISMYIQGMTPENWRDSR